MGDDLVDAMVSTLQNLQFVISCLLTHHIPRVFMRFECFTAFPSLYVLKYSIALEYLNILKYCI